MSESWSIVIITKLYFIIKWNENDIKYQSVVIFCCVCLPSFSWLIVQFGFILNLFVAVREALTLLQGMLRSFEVTNMWMWMENTKKISLGWKLNEYRFVYFKTFIWRGKKTVVPLYIQSLLLCMRYTTIKNISLSLSHYILKLIPFSQSLSLTLFGSSTISHASIHIYKSRGSSLEELAHRHLTVKSNA